MRATRADDEICDYWCGVALVASCIFTIGRTLISWPAGIGHQNQELMMILFGDPLYLAMRNNDEMLKKKIVKNYAAAHASFYPLVH